ncbi:Stp1/IreP family PP2C-type Ser/Thr phosphatase [Alteribacter natronophilus]|uniref:Stp1/IreP family PP2C-type Ser/Thr phosphatase n=1 Tax=Alteribacter natronophilus TaxID=2583810 RepID=UPI00110EAD6A|nr:Stp1/IreP family PP2C-type Ser/Thr phosphatase [Alteribacter natronophilus]TMW73169.1 Stp1/IreP family PP2C-type Ser/Thr phosphatase [Alteribacter natronophilus]
MEAVFKTDTGLVRAHNEDDGAYASNNEGQLLVVVADGMGGHQAGDVASRMTKELLMKKWRESEPLRTPVETEQWLEKTIREINRELYHHAAGNPDCQGMGTTVVAAVCSDQYVTTGHVGDSRIYLMEEDEDGNFRQITTDHSLVGELVRSGQITEDEAMHHPRRNVVLRALGTEVDVKVDTETIGWEPGSCLLLCTDGLTDKVQGDEIGLEMQRENDLSGIADSLIRMANDRGGEDNVTIAIVRRRKGREGGGDQ